MTTYTANTDCTSLEDLFLGHDAIVENMPIIDISFKEEYSPETRWEPADYSLDIYSIEVSNKEDYTPQQLIIINKVIDEKEEEIVEEFEDEMTDPSNYDWHGPF